MSSTPRNGIVSAGNGGMGQIWVVSRAEWSKARGMEWIWSWRGRVAGGLGGSGLGIPTRYGCMWPRRCLGSETHSSTITTGPGHSHLRCLKKGPMPYPDEAITTCKTPHSRSRPWCFFFFEKGKWHLVGPPLRSHQILGSGRGVGLLLGIWGKSSFLWQSPEPSGGTWTPLPVASPKTLLPPGRSGLHREGRAAEERERKKDKGVRCKGKATAIATTGKRCRSHKERVCVSRQEVCS